MTEESKLTNLFRNRLSDAGMDVRPGFWEDLQHDLPAAPFPKKSLWTIGLHRMAAAASVALVLGAATAAFWYLSPREKEDTQTMQTAEILPTQGIRPAEPLQDTPLSSPNEYQTLADGTSPIRIDGGVLHTTTADTDDNNASMSLHLSITILQRMFAKQPMPDRQQMMMDGWKRYQLLAGGNAAANDRQEAPVALSNEQSAEHTLPTENKNRNAWAWQLGVGTSLPKGDCHMPLTVAATAERRLNRTLAIETGLQYTCLPSDTDSDLHTLAVPVKLNVMLASTSKLDLYATVGGAAEKSLNHSFHDDPVRLSALAGLGVRYRVGDRVALFAEPTVSHHFDTDTHIQSLRTERATNMNLLCGVRMTY